MKKNKTADRWQNLDLTIQMGPISRGFETICRNGAQRRLNGEERDG